MDTITERTVARFVKAVTSLKNALKLPELPEHAERDSAVLRFELTAELMSKVLRRILSERGADVSLPKDIVRAAHTGELVTEVDTSVLLAVIDDRNRMVHDYSEEFARRLFKSIKEEYAPVFQRLADQISK
jgi:nucleotidyltransferase substrate binding protein (TIGR01987 family)